MVEQTCAILIKSMISKLSVRRFILSLLIVFSLIVVWPLFHSGLPPTHDGEYHVVRAYQFDKTLRDGDFYPRWLPDLNYGYGTPLMNYYYPLPYYAMSIVHFFGASFIDAFKVCLFIATLIGTVFFFLWARIFWGNSGGFISSLFYTFAPYHIVEIYVRGALGEVLAIAFLPAFLWSITKVIKEKKDSYFPISAVFFALIIFSHNILALMFFPFILSYIIVLCVLNTKKLFIIHNSLFIIILGLGLSAIFWLPAIMERSYVIGLQIYNIKESFPELYQLIFPSWGTGFSESDLNGKMSFQIGTANLFAVFLSIISFLIFSKKNDRRRLMVGFFLCWFAFVFFLLQKVSLPIWENIPFMNYFQFTWRYLALEILVCSMLAGSIFSYLKGKKEKIILCLMTGMVIALSIGYINPAYYLERNDSYYLTRPNFMDGTNSPGNLFNTIWFSKDINKRKSDKFEIIGNGKGIITKKSIKSTTYLITVSAKEQILVRVNTAYFPGWEVYVDGKKTNILKNKEGLISFFVNPGNHEVKIQFNDTTPRTMGKIVSFVSFSLLLFFLIRKR